MKITGILFSVLVIEIAISGCTHRKITYFHSEAPKPRPCAYAPIKTQSTLPEPIGKWVVHVELIKATKYIPAPYIPNSGNQYGMAIDFLYQSDKDRAMYKSLFESVEDRKDFFWRTSYLPGYDSTWYKDTTFCFSIDSTVIECFPVGDDIVAISTTRFFINYSGFAPHPSAVYPISPDPGSEECGWGQAYIGNMEDYGGSVYTERPSIQFEYFDLPKDTDSVRVSFDVTMLDKSQDEEITKHNSTVLYKYVAKL